jgi:hypothetical protein
MGTGGASDDLRAERADRMEAAHRRAAEAGDRAAEAGDRAARLRADQEHHRRPEGPARGSTAEELAVSRRSAGEAEEHLVRAFERGALAHDRAAELHERQAAELDERQAAELHERQAADERRTDDRVGPDRGRGPRPAPAGADGAGTGDPKPTEESRDHLVQAQEHRQAAAADRDRATAARHRRDAPAD